MLGAFGKHVGDTDQNNTLWFGVPSIAPGMFHMGTLLRSSQMIFDGNISPAFVRSAVCADRKDDRNWAALSEAQGEQEKPLPPIPVGKV